MTTKSRFLTSCLALAMVSVAEALPVINASFEAGNFGFSSDYTYAPLGNSTEGEYTVRSDPQNWNGAFVNFGDHTTGSGQMLVVNGATSGSNALWRETFIVSAGTSYDFSAWAGTAVGGGPASLLLRVDGTVVGPAFTLPNNPGAWVSWSTSWTAVAGGTSTVEIVNSNLSVFPNDFYIDDIAISDRLPASPVPDISSTGMLLALPLCLLMMARRRRIA
jgi:hypothetical protein